MVPQLKNNDLDTEANVMFIASTRMSDDSSSRMLLLNAFLSKSSSL